MAQKYDINDVVRVKHIVSGKVSEIRGTDIENWKKHGYVVIGHVRRELPEAVPTSAPEDKAPPIESEAAPETMVDDLELDADLKGILSDLGINTAAELNAIDDKTLLSFEPIGDARLKAIKAALAPDEN